MPASSPAGGNFLASDAAFNPDAARPQDRGEAISQLITGLTVGMPYNVSFYWAAGQQKDFYFDTWSSWQVSFGNQSQTTGDLVNPDRTFQPWRLASMTFTAQSASQLLEFVAKGGPQGLPPFAFLDGISVQAAVPELTNWAMLIIGIGLVGAMSRRRKVVAAA